MPRIDPSQLLATLSVLLGPGGGIKSTEEVSRLVQLMQKFSKKLVSKVIYIKILKASKPELLDKFLEERGWDLLNFWFTEAIRSSNWPLCQELMQLFVLCPMTAQRLRENTDQNVAPKLVRQLTCDPRVDRILTQLSTQVLNKWMTLVQPPVEGPALPAPAPVRTRARGQIKTPPAQTTSSSDGPRVIVNVHTEPSPEEEIVNLPGLSGNAPVPDHAEPELWVGKGRNVLKMSARIYKGNKGAPRMIKQQPTAAGKAVPTRSTIGSKAPITAHDEDEEEDVSDDDDAEYRALLQRSSDALNRRLGLATAAKSADKASVVTTNVAAATSASYSNAPKMTTGFQDSCSPAKETGELVAMRTGDMNGTVKDELTDIDDLLKDAEQEEQNSKPVSVLQGLANDLAETLKKEKEDIKKEDSKTDSKNKENRKEGSGSKSEPGKTRTLEEEERRRKEKEERRRREKEREREKRKKEEREKKRESRPYKETEMRNDLDSSEKAKIKMMAQRLKEEAKKQEGLPRPAVASLPKIPKLPKREGDDKKPKSDEKKSSSSLLPPPSFEDLLGAMDGKAKVGVKAPFIKNKNRDLLASISSSPPQGKTRQEAVTKSVEKSGKPSVGDFVKDMIRPIRTEDKSLKIIPAAALEKMEVDKRPEKRRPSADEPEQPKIKVKSALQLKESPLFGDFLSTIMKDDQPKKKKIKIAELKAKNKEEEEKERLERENAAAETETVPAAAGFSFYRDTMEENEVMGGDVDESAKLPPPPTVEVDKNSSSSIQGAIPVDEVGQRDSNAVVGADDNDLPFAEPSSELPREVRGILVYARGKGRKGSRRITWPESDANLVQVEYFELDETERVNVNKLKFEEIRKREHMLEKNSMAAKAVAVEEDGRPWPGLLSGDFAAPSIEYGGQSVEKTTQKQRENSVLQALYFNNRPNDPSEPETGGLLKGVVTKHIPLEDESGEDAVIDYSEVNWPLPIGDEFGRPMADPRSLKRPGQQQPAADAIYATIQQNLQSMMGGFGAEEEVNAGMSIAMYAAQKAAEEALRQQGLLPPQTHHRHAAAAMFPSGDEGAVVADGTAAFDPMDEPMDMDYGGVPDDGNMMMHPEIAGGGGLLPEPGDHFHNQMGPAAAWRGGGPRFPHHRGGGGPRDFRGGGRDFRGGHSGRGFFRGGSGFSERFHHSDRKPLGGGGRGSGRSEQDNRVERGGGYRGDFRDSGGFPPRRPCKFWMEKGFCREEGRCKFPHPQR